MPAAFIAAMLAAIICLFLFLISEDFMNYTPQKRILMALGIMFGTWLWTNLVMAGAWQLTLGFAMIGELGAIYFTVYKTQSDFSRAGVFRPRFRQPHGNCPDRADLFASFFLSKLEVQGSKFKVDEKLKSKTKILAKRENTKRRSKRIRSGKTTNESHLSKSEIGQFLNLKSTNFKCNPKPAIVTLATFCAVPFVLGVSTLIYNKMRFHSFTDFGYARIPGVLDEPWYNHGIFSYYYIPGQAYEMLLKPWEILRKFSVSRARSVSAARSFGAARFCCSLFRCGVTR